MELINKFKKQLTRERTKYLSTLNPKEKKLFEFQESIFKDYITKGYAIISYNSLTGELLNE